MYNSLSHSLCGRSFRMAEYKCCSFSEDSMEEETEVFILGDVSNGATEMQQSFFRSASVSTLSVKVDPSSGLCLRNTSVPCDLSNLSTYSDVCQTGPQRFPPFPCNCSSATTCKCKETPVELMLSEACTLVSPAAPLNAESPPLKFTPSMHYRLRGSIGNTGCFF